MTTQSYLIYTNSETNSIEGLVALFNIAGVAIQLFGEGHKTLWVIKKGKQTIEKVKSQLRSIPLFKEVDVVEFKNPISESELRNTRELFSKLDWNSKNVTNIELTNYLLSVIENKFKYYIDTEGRYQGNSTVEIKIRPLEEHPAYNSEWLTLGNKEVEEDVDKVYTIDDFYTVTDITEIEIKVDDPPTPPNRGKEDDFDKN